MHKLEGFNKGSERLRIYVIDPNDLYWPLPWYLRDYEKAAYSKKIPSNQNYDAIIVPAQYQMYRQLPEEKFASYNFTLRPTREFTLYYNKKLEKNR
jgi:predicted membrane-bound mannosyltransferase